MSKVNKRLERAWTWGWIAGAVVTAIAWWLSEVSETSWPIWFALAMVLIMEISRSLAGIKDKKANP
jgi:hypothetical protein